MVLRPLLLIDVDGPLNPWAAKPTKRPEGYVTHRMRPSGWEPHLQKRPLRVWLNPQHGPGLLALPFDLVWATTWAHQANEMIGPHVGLPELPVIEWPEDRGEPESPFWRSKPQVFWKTETVVRYVDGRAFAWLDDDITDLDRDYVSRHHGGPALLHYVDPAKGLLLSDFEALTGWANSVAVRSSS